MSSESKTVMVKLPRPAEGSILARPAEQLEKQIRRNISNKKNRIKRKLNWKTWLRRQIKWRWLKSIVPR